MKRKRISMFMAFMMLVGMVTACSGPAAQEGGASSKGTTTSAGSGQGGTQESAKEEVPTLVFQVNDNALVEAIGDEVAKFEEEHNCNVEIISGFNGWPDYWSKLLTSIAGGTGPDVATLKETHLGELHGKGALLDLTDFIAADDEVKEEDFVDVLWDTVSFDGRVYANYSRNIPVESVRRIMRNEVEYGGKDHRHRPFFNP